MSATNPAGSVLPIRICRRQWLAHTAITSLGGWACSRQAWAAPADEVEIPEPQPLTISTKDLATLKITYYPGLFGKKSIPIIMVHDWRGQRTEFDALAKYIQRQRGFAVVTVDLRGHGESTRQKMANGDERNVSADELKPVDFMNMVKFDLEAVKKFLVERNNAEELNVAQTGIIAVGQMGTVVALNWVLQDWSWPSIGSFKQGQDVQGMVLVSPSLNFKSLKTSEALKHPFVGGRVSTMLAGGKVEPDIKKMYTQFKAKHPPIPADADEARKHQTLWLVQEDTELRGTQLLTEPALRRVLFYKILVFLELRFTAKADEYPWAERKNPLSEK